MEYLECSSLIGQCVESDAAPLLDDERLTRPSTLKTRRLRRRGPRSVESLAKRSLRFLRKCPEEIRPGKSRLESPPSELKLQPLIILNVNIRSVMGKIDELIAVVEDLGVNLILVQESWLD